MDIHAAEQALRSCSRPLLARPGHNCWRTDRADAFGLVIDGQEYFRALKQALLSARSSIIIVGWEFDSRTALVRGEPTSDPNQIGPLLDHLVRTRPGLTVHVLIWDSALIYAFNREFAGFVKMDWLTHRRLRFRLDDSHPLGASHHQKIVVIDDRLAFVGGIDLTSQRWDTRAHRADEPLRSDPAFPSYPPFHDMMAVLSGPAARALGDVTRDRWFRSTGQRLAPPAVTGWRLWPDGVPILAEGVEIAVARTMPAWDGGGEIREIEALYLDMIGAARRFIYVENQYFASRRVADALAERLGSDDCPEIVLVCPGEQVSLVERSTMGVARARLMRRLSLADKCGRLRLYCPTVAGRDVKVHAKLMIVDDQVLRIGSSNLNNRSMWLDSECDIMIEANGDARSVAVIRAIRHDLMAEHLGVDAAMVAAAEERCGGMLAAIDALAGGERTLTPLDEHEPGEIVQIIADSALPDPEEPVEALAWLDKSMPGPAKRGLQMRVWSLTALLAGLTLAAALWRWAPLSVWQALWPVLDNVVALRGDPLAVPLVLVGFLFAGLLRLPVSLASLVSAALLGMGTGFAVSLAGALISAMTTYGMGRALGRARVRRLAGWKVNRVNRVLARHGLIAVLLLRLMPVAAFSVVNAVAGAACFRLRDFVLGTVLGMAPGLLALSILGDRLAAVVETPTGLNIVVLMVLSAVVVAAQFCVIGRLGRARAFRRTR